jgi:hypothetical protein
VDEEHASVPHAQRAKLRRHGADAEFVHAGEGSIRACTLDIMPGDRDGYEYDVCFSFAGEQRKYVEQVARILHRADIKVFYDAFEQAEVWGKDLKEHLTAVYRDRARYCVIFVSEQYAKKRWPTLEHESAQARAIQASEEYILPARFDDTDLPGLSPTVASVDLRSITPPQLAEIILTKLQLPAAAAGPRLQKGKALGGCVSMLLLFANLLATYLVAAILFWTTAGTDLFAKQIAYNWNHWTEMMLLPPSYYASLLFVVAAIVIAVPLSQRGKQIAAHCAMASGVIISFVVMTRVLYTATPGSPLAPHIDAISAKILGEAAAIMIIVLIVVQYRVRQRHPAR